MENKGDAEVAVDGGQVKLQENPNGPHNDQGVPGPVPVAGSYAVQGPDPVAYPGQPQPQGPYPPPPAYTTLGQPATSVPPPPPGYVVGTHQTVIRQGFTQLPCSLTCPNCNSTVTTVTHKEVGLMVWLMVGGMILVGLWLGCCLIPFCIDSLHDTVHTCPVCKHTVGKFTHM